MKKIKFIIALIFVNLFGYGQTTITGIAAYKKISNTIDLSKMDQKMREEILKINKETDRIEYVLNFNNSESYFFAKEILLENFSFTTFVVLGGGKLKLYQNKSTNECREFVDNRRVGKVIVDRKVLQEWTLTNENKLISGYKCYKATTPVFKSDGTKKTDLSSLVTAWYCPEIPTKMGPNGYGDLPGLILELQTTANTFLATNISLNPNKEVFIDKLTEPKAISEKELNERAMSSFNPEQLKAIDESKSKK